MDLQALIIFLAIGVVGGYVFGLLGISAGGLVGSIITATVGAALLLFLIGLIKKTSALPDKDMLPAGLHGLLLVANPPEKQAGDSRSRH